MIAIFSYDGDGRRVKAVETMSLFTKVFTTGTYFVGNYYEVTGGVVTKYYYAGSQRIAMRTNGALSFLLGDHLGSTSLTADVQGSKLAELRYTAWGVVRYTSGTTPTRYHSIGQYSMVPEFGLIPVLYRGLYYNARWDDPINFMSLYPSGRFESALHNVSHEFGYAFNGGHGSIQMNSMPDNYLSQRNKILASAEFFCRLDI